ncbi:MAG TPA: ATP synthase F1 subunit delta [Phycisphaerae bacterium]|nr:ATP synthase F1 subunit delta [Phycisphaerae bacterium]
MQDNLPEISPVARAYAEALLDVAQNTGQLDDVAADIAALKALRAAASDITKFLKAASISTEEKLHILRETLEPLLNPLTMRTIESMARRDRLELLHDLVDAFDAQMEERKNRIRVELSVPQPVSSEDHARLEQAMSGKLGKQVVLRTIQKPELIGGGQLRIDDLLIDGSIRYRLEQMRRHMREKILSTPGEQNMITV